MELLESSSSSSSSSSTSTSPFSIRRAPRRLSAATLLKTKRQNVAECFLEHVNAVIHAQRFPVLPSGLCRVPATVSVSSKKQIKKKKKQRYWTGDGQMWNYGNETDIKKNNWQDICAMTFLSVLTQKCVFLSTNVRDPDSRDSEVKSEPGEASSSRGTTNPDRRFNTGLNGAHVGNTTPQKTRRRPIWQQNCWITLSETCQHKQAKE